VPARTRGSSLVMSLSCLLRFSLSRPALARDTLLENLHDNRRVLDCRLADRQMKMLGHDDVTGHKNLVLLSGFFQNLQEQVTPER